MFHGLASQLRRDQSERGRAFRYEGDAMEATAERVKPTKPLGHKAYGSIPHLIGSRRGPSDCGVNEGQQRICTEKCRPGDTIIVQEKLDGSNVAVAKINGVIVPLIRAGYRADESHYRQHHIFAAWVYERQGYFLDVLNEGDRLCGEWLAQAHGTIYDLTDRSPFVAFDLFIGHEFRVPYRQFLNRLALAYGVIATAPVLFEGCMALPVEDALKLLRDRGHYGAQEPAEGVVYRVERNGKVDFLAKYVRPEKVDGKYLGEERWLWKEGD